MPPTGMAICVARSPVNVRCGPLWNNSSNEYGSGSEARATGASDAGESGWPKAPGTAAPKAADEVLTKNSLRVDIKPPKTAASW